jgi:mRNA-degrading endonuclease RelE of RelBE toxin-antitoxin system
MTSISLSSIGKWVEDNRDASHEEIASKFSDWVQVHLDYHIDNKTLRLAEAKEKGIPDIQCKDLNEKTILVIEIKTDSDHIEKAANRRNIEDDQLTRYLTDNSIDPAYLILTDGAMLFFYENRNRTLMPVANQSMKRLAEASPTYESTLIKTCTRPEINYLSKEPLDSYLEFTRKYPQHLDSKTGIDFFASKFSLDPKGPFGELVKGCLSLMQYLEKKSRFFVGAFEFWSRTLFNEPEKIPDSWKSLMKNAGLDLSTGPKQKEAVRRFEFALETAYNIFSRLIMAKAIDDFRFHEIIKEDSPLVVFKKNLKFVRGTTNPIYYSVALVKLTDKMREGFVKSIFEMDIFDWWVDAFIDEDKNLNLGEVDFAEIEQITDARMDFSKSIMRLFGQLSIFDFSELGEDLFGVLYQVYFDKETRKALGEFYTPREVVNFILDQSDYRPGSSKRPINARIIDPACGSGTFLIESIKRFLKDARNAGVTSREALDRLCNRIHVVGLDIHPFAAQLAKLNFLLNVLPAYRDAVKEDPNFILKRIPIYRTDSLYNELRATQKGKVGQTAIDSDADAGELEFGIPLPIKSEDGRFVHLILELPTKESVEKQLNLNGEEYFEVLQALFNVIRKVSEDKQIDQLLHKSIETTREAHDLLKNLTEAFEGKKKTKFDELGTIVRRENGQPLYNKFAGLLRIHFDNLTTLKGYDVRDIAYNSIVKYLSREVIPGVKEKTLELLDKSLRDQGLKNIDYLRIARFFQPYCMRILLDSKYLKYRFGDGRLISSIEDRILSILLKHYFHYDFVVANPPYVRIQKVAQYDSGLQDHYNAVHSDVTIGNYDIYIPFISMGLSLLSKDGVLGYICSNRFAAVNYGAGIREHILKNSRIALYFDFRDTGVFEDALNYPVIFVLKKDGIDSPIICGRMKSKPEGKSDEDILKLISGDLGRMKTSKDHLENESFDVFGFDSSRLQTSGWYFMPHKEQIIFDKIREPKEVLSDYTESAKSGSALFEGSSTGNKEIYVVNLLSETKDRVTVFSSSDQKTWELEKEITRPYVEDSGKWTPSISESLVVFPYTAGAQNEYEIIEPDELEKSCPLTWKYLHSHKIALQGRKGFKQRDDWYAYSAPRSLNDYEQDKFMIQGFTRSSCVSIDLERKTFFGPDIYGLRIRKLEKEDALFLLAVLNSDIANFYVKHVGVVHGAGYYKFEDRFVKELPIKMAGDATKKKIAKKVTELCDLAGRTFPRDYIKGIRTFKIGDRLGDYQIIIKNNRISISFKSHHLKIHAIQKDMNGCLRIELDKDSFIRCPAKIHWEFIEKVLLSHSLRSSGKVSITVSDLQSIFMPIDDKETEKATESYKNDINRVTALEDDLNRIIFKAYGIDEIESGKGVETVKTFLNEF